MSKTPLYNDMILNLNHTKNVLIDTTLLLLERGESLNNLESKSNELLFASNKFNSKLHSLRSCFLFLHKNYDFIITTLACCGSFEDPY